MMLAYANRSYVSCIHKMTCVVNYIIFYAVFSKTAEGIGLKFCSVVKCLMKSYNTDFFHKCRLSDSLFITMSILCFLAI